MKTVKTISIKCDCDKTIDFHELQSFQGGLKERTESDYEKAKKSILQYGWSFVLYYWNDGKKKWIIDGHNRVEVLNRLEAEGYLIPPIPAIEVFCKNRKEAKQKLLRLNSTFGHLTKESVLEFASDIDLNFDEIALPDTTICFEDEQETQETQGDDDIPDIDEKEKPNSERGCMYELGNSILMCGDSTSAEDVARLMGGEKASLVLTDPPYGISVVQNNSVGGSKPPTFGTVGGGKFCKVHTYEKIIGDETTETAKKSFEIYSELSENQIIFGGNYFTDFLPPSRCWLVWDKENTGNFADAELAWTSFDKGVKLYKHLWNGMSREGNRKDEGKTRVHPTQKPVGMLQKILEDFTEKGETVLDVFGGSGSTLIACEGTGRKCLMIEMSENYCDVIRKRYTKWCKENNKPLSSGCLADD